MAGITVGAAVGAAAVGTAVDAAVGAFVLALHTSGQAFMTTAPITALLQKDTT